MEERLEIKLRIALLIGEHKQISRAKTKNIAQLVLYPRKVSPQLKLQLQGNHQLAKLDKDFQLLLISRRLDLLILFKSLRIEHHVCKETNLWA